MTTGFVVLIILDTSEKRNTSEKKIHVISKNVGSCLTLLKETCSNEDPEGDDAAEIKNVRPFLEDETRIVLIGKIGAGKSSTANSLLGCHFFHESDVPTLVTSKCEMVKGTVRRKPFLLIDTPGILGVNENERETEMEIKKCIILAAPGPHAILFIIEYGRIRKDDIESIKTFLKYFGQNLKHFTIIVFTHAEKVKEYQTTDQWLRELPDLENFVNECERRYCLINNKANARDKEQYAMCIMNAIEALKFKNYKLYYTDDATMRNNTQVVVKYCCANYEMKKGTCIECRNGFTSVNGSSCMPCTGIGYGQKCLHRCSCTEIQMCHHIYGCIPLQLTSVNVIFIGSTGVYPRLTASDTKIKDNENNESKQESQPFGQAITIYSVCIAGFLVITAICFICLKRVQRNRAEQLKGCNYRLGNEFQNAPNLFLNVRANMASLESIYHEID